MFSWICPKCGRDVPPSKTDCPWCADREKEAAAIAAQAPPPPLENLAPPPPPVQAAWQPPPPVQAAWQPPPQPIQPQPTTWHRPPARSAPPTWLMGLGFAAAFILVGAGLYFGIQKFGASAAQKAGVENPSNPSRQKVTNPLQKYLEVVGVRLIAANKKPTARFVIVNHSGAEINDLAANVTLWASDSRSEEDAVGSFKFSLPSIGPYESKDMTAPLKTKLKMYELPDWQNETAEIQITSPAAP
jgi:hypothetical protein